MLAQTFKANHCHSVQLSDSATETEVNNTIREFNENCILSNDVNTDPESIGVIIKSLENQKALGIDGINNLCLKALPKNGIKYLTILINSCIYHGYFPEKFKEAKVIPISQINLQTALNHIGLLVFYLLLVKFWKLFICETTQFLPFKILRNI